MITVHFHPQAEAELIAVATWYDEQQKNLGKRFISTVEDGISRLKINPLLFPLIDNEVRRCLTRTFRFGILFRYRNERIEVIAVMHLRREPGYWLERL